MDLDELATAIVSVANHIGANFLIQEYRRLIDEHVKITDLYAQELFRRPPFRVLDADLDIGVLSAIYYAQYANRHNS